MKIGDESLDQIALFKWIRLQPKISPFIFHIAGERKCSPQYGAFLKKMGCMAGVADIFVAMPKGQYHGLWIELKSLKGRMTPKQTEFLENMRTQGYMAVCAKGFETAKVIIESYLEL